MGKWVYRFGSGHAEGTSAMRALLGGKGANLAEMSNLGLPVPPGFIITTEVCTHFYANDRTYPADLDAQIDYLDGITVTYPDWWVNVRPSNTEPFLRMCLEADTAELREQKKAELMAILGSPADH